MCIFNGVIFISEQENTALTVMLAAISNEAAVWKKALVTEKNVTRQPEWSLSKMDFFHGFEDYATYHCLIQFLL